MVRGDGDSNSNVERRRLLKAMGALSAVGLAGCSGDGGDDGTDTTDDPGTGPDTTDSEGTDESTPEGTDETTPEDTATPTPTSGGPLSDPDPLIGLETSTVSPAAETLNASIVNPYLFEIQDGSVELSGPDGWEFSNASGVSFDTLSNGASQDASWDMTIPDGANGEVELTADVTYTGQGSTVETSTTLTLTVDVWQGAEFTEVATFNDFFDGVEDRKWMPGNGWTPEGSDEWGGQGASNWYKLELDMSAFLPADQIQIKLEDSFPGGWGISLWDTRLVADGEEAAYVRTVYDDDETDYIYEDNASKIDGHSEGNSDDQQRWRYADTNNAPNGGYWVYEFDVPDDTDDLTVELTLRNGFTISARTFPRSDATKEDVGQSMTPALRVPYTGDDGGGVGDASSTYPQTPARTFLFAPEFNLPHGATYEYIDESAVDTGAMPWDTNEDIRAELYFGYDDDNFYMRADVTDDTHVGVGGADMWQGDSLQIAAGDDEYGPEYGVASVDGSTEVQEYSGGAASGPDAMDVTVTRDGSLTSYEATIPWDALYEDFTVEAGANAPFGVLVNEADTDDGERDAVLGWTLPGINDEKTVDALGTLLIENRVDNSGN
jgi:hypothetical protein